MAGQNMNNMDLKIDKSKWQPIRFGNVSIQQKENVIRDSTELTRYIAGEHMGTEDLHLRTWGEINSDYLGPAFHRRFEKFHMIHYDPYPIINGWIAWWMLAALPIGFSRLSLYLQHPHVTHFSNFNCGTLPEPLNLSLESNQMRTFIIELAVRSMHVPIK